MRSPTWQPLDGLGKVCRINALPLRRSAADVGRPAPVGVRPLEKCPVTVVSIGSRRTTFRSTLEPVLGIEGVAVRALRRKVSVSVVREGQ